MGKVNEAGAELLSFCALNELTIMNTISRRRISTSSPGSILGANSGTASTMLSCAKSRGGYVVMLVWFVVQIVGQTISSCVQGSQ